MLWVVVGGLAGVLAIFPWEWVFLTISHYVAPASGPGRVFGHDEDEGGLAVVLSVVFLAIMIPVFFLIGFGFRRFVAARGPVYWGTSVGLFVGPALVNLIVKLT
ncbi:hypothetical protein [Nakamurella leprariae]|uniref:Uncharacterized protein n=1 Tax=Nakamurella leprariae TaxID=2803911 RepID=A0A939C0V5_9ACTN|nr:hypothetical protein [Nakamurella leprariae]MBM9469630.1 hypothetical protein [Nakamurella leprariae]